MTRLIGKRALVTGGSRGIGAAIARQLEVQTSRGTVQADLSYSGAIYASVDAASVGLAVTPEHYTDLIAIGRLEGVRTGATLPGFGQR